MSDLDRIMAALKKADAAGNTEDATKLAGLARKLSQRTQPPKIEKEKGALPFANEAIAGTLGAPVDLVTAGLNLIPGVDIKEPFGGSESIEKGMSNVGIQLPEEGEQPESIPEYIGQSIGEVASLVIPIGKAAQTLSKGTGVVSSIAKTITNSIAKHPYITATSELTGGVGTGVGRGVGEKLDSPVGESLAEIGGGIIGGLAPTALVNAPSLIALRAGKTLLSKMTLPFTEQGSKFRAGKFIKRQVVDPSKTIETISKETIGDLPPAVASGEKKLVTLYKSLVGQDPATDSEAIESLSKSIIKLEKEMRGLGYGSPDLLAEITEKRIAALEISMDTRTLKAMERVQTKIDALPVAKRKVAESRIVRTELESVMRQERTATNDLWNDVSKDFKVNVDHSKKAYAVIIDDLSKAEMNDIPVVLKKSFIFKEGKTAITETNIKEMQGLRSKLLEVSRQSRKDGKFNKARIAENVANAILEDIGVTAKGSLKPEAAALKTAIEGSKKFNQRFKQGTVGKILGYGKEGAPAIDPDITLDISLGRMAQKGSLDVDKVVVTPEAVDAAKRYIGRNFTDYTLDKKTGLIDPIKAKSWVKNNEALLDKFPNLQKQLTDAGSAQDFANRTKVRMDARKKSLRDPKISASAKFLNFADMGKAASSVFKSKNPAKMAMELAKQANQDVTGDAIAGLRSGFVERLLAKSSVGAFNELGEQALSGRKLLSMLNKEKAPLAHIFKPEQLSRMRRVAIELTKAEAFDKTSYNKVNIEMEDVASTGLTLLSRVGGLKLGHMFAKATGGAPIQTPAIFAERFKALGNSLSKDRAFQMIHDAVTSKDPALLKALLLPIDKPTSVTGKKNILILNKQINTWLVGTGKRVLDNMNEDKE